MSHERTAARLNERTVGLQGGDETNVEGTRQRLLRPLNRPQHSFRIKILQRQPLLNFTSFVGFRSAGSFLFFFCFFSRDESPLSQLFQLPVESWPKTDAAAAVWRQKFNPFQTQLIMDTFTGFTLTFFFGFFFDRLFIPPERGGTTSLGDTRRRYWPFSLLRWGGRRGTISKFALFPGTILEIFFLLLIPASKDTSQQNTKLSSVNHGFPDSPIRILPRCIKRFAFL